MVRKRRNLESTHPPKLCGGWRILRSGADDMPLLRSFAPFSIAGSINMPLLTELSGAWLNCGGSFLGRQFADERPGYFGDLAVVVVDEEATLAPVFNLQMIELSLGRNLVGASNVAVLFQDADAIHKIRHQKHLP